MTDSTPKSLLRRLIGVTLAVLAAVWIILEDWLWDLMQSLMAWLGKLPPVRWLQVKIAVLPPYGALAVFLVPAMVLLPFKIAALWLIARHHTILGLQVFIAAKLVGTALLAWIFSLTKPSLMTIGWFARAYTWFVNWKKRIFDYVRALPAYLRIHAALQAAKARLKAWWRQRAA